MKKMIMFLLLNTLAAGASTMAQGSGYNVGDKASDFKLKNVDGKMVSLADYKDAKGFIVVFTCNHCPYAKAYEDRITALNAKFQPIGYPVIAINPNDPTQYPEDSYENMQKRANEKGYKFPYLFDADQTVYPAYGATRTPHVYVLTRKGNELIVEYIGAIDDNYEDASKVTHSYVAEAVNALLENKKPEITSTKAIGCSIKAKMAH